MFGKTPFLPSFDQHRSSPNPVSSSSSSSSACPRVIIGFEIAIKEDGNRAPSLLVQRQTSLAAMPSFLSLRKGNPSFRLDKPETTLVIDHPPPPTPPGTRAIPNPKHPLPLAQSEVEKKLMAKPVPRQSRVRTANTHSIFHLHVAETQGSSLYSSCFEESAFEHPPRLTFLQSCFFCHRSLSMAKDIYMYRGDRAFCSVDCRYQQILIDDWNERFSAASSMPDAQPHATTTMYAC